MGLAREGCRDSGWRHHHRTHDSKGERIRIYGVDCPEGGHDLGNCAKQFTSSLLFKRAAEVKPVTMDRYGRTVAMVYVGNKCVSEELLKSGFAWVFTQYFHESFCGEWRRLEDQARKSRLGL
jgi:micrococcal nuclease